MNDPYIESLKSEIATLRAELAAVKAQRDELKAVLFKHWSSDYSGYERCDFCGVTQGRPSIERHKENCPRLIWAVENNQTPAKRAEAMGAYHDYVDKEILTPGDLSPEGRRIAEAEETA